MLGTITQWSPKKGITDDIKAASAAGRSDGRRKTAGAFKAASRGLKGSGGMSFAYMALMMGVFPR